MEEINIYPKVIIEGYKIDILSDFGNTNIHLVPQNSIKVPTNVFITTNVIYDNQRRMLINSDNELINVLFDTNTHKKKNNIKLSTGTRRFFFTLF